MTEIFVLALAVGAISLTLTKAQIFEWLRNLVGRISTWLGELFDCPYCMAHWVALGTMFLYKPILIASGHGWLDLFVSYFALVALGSLVAGAIYRLFGGD